MIDLSLLNPPQKEAVLYGDGPLLVLAGAGSGKTRVLTHRIARLIDEGVAPWSILAITFTNKAAKEMRQRIIKLSGEAAEDCWISTFHSSCARILRMDIEKLGYQRQFSIYDDDDQTSAIKAILREMNLNEKEYPPRLIKSCISDAKNKLQNAEEWLAKTDKSFRAQKIAEIFTTYEKRLRSNNALDFDDLLLKTLELFAQHPPVLEGYRRKFRYILVDEYQDTNTAQYEFVRLLAGDRQNVCVVGDDDQSIYGWRGADIRNILEFEKDFPNCKVIKLEQNYRSTGTILDAANSVIAHNKSRKFKKLWTQSEQGEKIRVYNAMDERDEAAWICSQLRGLGDYAKCAILYRANAQSRVLEEALVRSGIPYRVFGGLKFYDRKEVKDIICYLRILVNPSDDVSLRRIINEPKRGIGDTTVEALQEYALVTDDSLFNAMLDYENAPITTRARKGVAQFAELMTSLISARFEFDEYTKDPARYVRFIIDKTGYEQQYRQEKTDENASRLENIQELVSAVDQYTTQNPDGGLEGFLENVALVTDMDRSSDEMECVTLMTMHSAKGLEFPYVFISGMEENVFPITRAVDSPDDLEEERRLCYVAITRAMKRLFITHANMRTLFGRSEFHEMSRFIREIPKELIDDGRKYREPVQRVPSTQVSHPVSTVTPSAPRSTKPPILGIPGVQKGFGQATAKVVPSQAREYAPVSLFKEGDNVMHKVYGKGVITQIIGEGREARIIILFDKFGEKKFPADTAPVVKV